MNPTPFTLFFILVGCLCFFIGYAFGNTRRGRLVKYTNNLPNGFLTVVSVDRVSAVLEEINVDRKRFLVSTEVFGGKPIRPKDVVRKIKNYKEQEELQVPLCGYPPLVKEILEEN